jgi:hypothetical protein
MPSGVPQDTNFSLVRGDARSWTLTVSFPPSAPSSDLNTYEIEMTAKKFYADADADAVFKLTKENGDITVDATNHNVAHLSLSSGNTAALPCSPPLNSTVLVYDVQLVGGDGRPYTVARGTITVVADATQVDS